MDPIQFHKCLGDETRLYSLLLIQQEGELCVCELTEALSESQPKISRHLAQLRKTGLLVDSRQGQWVFYRLNPGLPVWAQEVIVSTLRGNTKRLAPMLKRLKTMGERPQRCA